VSETVTHEGEEIIVILEGEIEQMLGDAVIRMCVGDCLHYSGATPHALSNTTAFPARVLWTGTLSVLHRRGGRYLPPLPAIDNTEND
jgi:uncharacterized cupin superfamily protein